MRLLIDMFVCQGAARNRGPSRYANSVTSAMLEHDGRHEVWLAANAALANGFEALRVRFGGRVPPGRLVPFHHLARLEGLGELSFEDCAQAAAFRCVQMLAPDVAWTPSAFEGWSRTASPSLSPVKSRSLLAATVRLHSAAVSRRVPRSVARLPHLVPEAARTPAAFRSADRGLRVDPPRCAPFHGHRERAHHHHSACRRRHLPSACGGGLRVAWDAARPRHREAIRPVHRQRRFPKNIDGCCRRTPLAPTSARCTSSC